MARGQLLALDASQQLEVAGHRATDTRPTVATGWSSLDSLLNRGGFAPGTFVILTGRTGTRKTTVTVNLIANMLAADVRVGFVALDEAPAQYVFKVASAVLDRPHEELEQQWSTPAGDAWRQQYRSAARRFTLSKGYRPGIEELTRWMDYANEEAGSPMQVVFLDYASLLSRDKFAGAEVQRIGRIIEDLQVWSNEKEVVLVALHQVGRFDEGSGGRYHGDTPMSLAGMKYGGEEVADVVLATYRPAKDPLGHMTLDDAFAYFPQGWKAEKVEDAWYRAQDRVTKYKDSTFLQLLKNRPGTQTHEEGIHLKSPSRSMRLVEAEADLNEGMQYTGAA